MAAKLFLSFLFISAYFLPILESCPCGKRVSGGSGGSNGIRIVGGQLARQSSWPWTAALVYVSHLRYKYLSEAEIHIADIPEVDSMIS
jgi:hypothetical protein